MILLAMMFTLTSRCAAAACTARGPVPMPYQKKLLLR